MSQGRDGVRGQAFHRSALELEPGKFLKITEVKIFGFQDVNDTAETPQSKETEL
jgi:hypothetical protein